MMGPHSNLMVQEVAADNTQVEKDRAWLVRRPRRSRQGERRCDRRAASIVPPAKTKGELAVVVIQGGQNKCGCSFRARACFSVVVA